ncbi:DDB1- and CUL4-associated factor 4-like [Actinia tenebrosa]|uniref:DDB1- and CUL4-associated factor 4-like n=1 Tax=Actinia tenebrosa TaxID=6105 RepID=A0A6P8IE37_ACTTE|nr:DDB1- and CUL4-associated factor 4-like [Actinia tenebrosa]
MPGKRRKQTTNKEAKCRLCGGVVVEKRQETTYRHIPGFIYDTEKKKYFRITHEIQCKMSSQEVNKESKICKKCSEVKRKRLKKQQNSSFVKFIMSRQYQQTDPLISQSEAMEKLVQQYRVRQSSKLHLTHVYAPEFAVSSIHPDLKHQRILTLYKTSGSEDPVVQFHQVSKDKNHKMSIVPGSSMMKDQLVTSLNWSPHPKTIDFFLITLLGHGDKWGEGLLFQVEELTQRFLGRYPMNRHSVWTSAWNKNPLYDNIISLGASNLALTFDVNTRHRLLRFPSVSDTFAQQFAFKVRASSGKYLPPHPSKNSSYDPIIRKWDLRMQRIVREYHGHVNQNTLRLPIFVDSTDSLLFAAGEDSLTRVWSVRTGEIVRTIPYPDKESKQIVQVPALCYSDEWGGPGGLPGLMYATNDNVRLYST